MYYRFSSVAPYDSWMRLECSEKVAMAQDLCCPQTSRTIIATIFSVQYLCGIGYMAQCPIRVKSLVLTFNRDCEHQSYIYLSANPTHFFRLQVSKFNRERRVRAVDTAFCSCTPSLYPGSLHHGMAEFLSMKCFIHVCGNVLMGLD